MRFCIDGMNLRQIARHLGAHHRTISLWVQAYITTLPKAPEKVEVVELDELFTFVNNKKRIYIVTKVDRETRCYLSWGVMPACPKLKDLTPLFTLFIVAAAVIELKQSGCDDKKAVSCHILTVFWAR